MTISDAADSTLLLQLRLLRTGYGSQFRRPLTVIRMLEEIGSPSRVPEFIRTVRTRERRLMGFGHRIYKSYDPRAKIIRRLAREVFEVTGKNPLIDLALELERIALEDDRFRGSACSGSGSHGAGSGMMKGIV